MPIAQALHTGVTGLSVNADGLSVTANNIANAGAKGFKKDRAEFEDMLSQNLSSGSQIGRGARLQNVKTIHTQGGLQVTDRLTDIAIQGNGFLVLSEPSANAAVSAGKKYTRVGSLHFDKNGYFADPTGARVQGYVADAGGTLSSQLSDVRIETNTIPPKQTDTLILNVQLDSRVKLIEQDFDLMKPEKTSHFNTAVAIFDSHGRAHQTTVFFKKLSSSAEGIDWEWHAVVSNSEVTDPDDGLYKEIASGVAKFSKNGFLREEVTEKSEVNFSDGAFPGQVVKFDFGRNIQEELGNGTNASTSIAGKSITVYHQQDGYEAGQLKTLEIGKDGMITGVFTNGEQRDLAAIALATFSNQDALQKAGSNQYVSSINSGPPNIGLPETGIRGKLYASALEESNVDLASEFVNMIKTQRLFQANSRSITTADKLTEEVINLKR